MRSTLLILCLSGGALAFGQAGPSFPFSVSPVPSGQAIQTAAPGWNFSKMPQWPRWDPSLNSRSQTVFRPGPQPTVQLSGASIDPQIVRHPTAKDLGTLPPGTQVAQNLYPGLVFQPIAGGRRCPPSSGPLATTWPLLKLETIPITWPAFKAEPAVAGSALAAAEPAR
jgi:hypothetical protein